MGLLFGKVRGVVCGLSLIGVWLLMASVTLLLLIARTSWLQLGNRENLLLVLTVVSDSC